MKCEDLTETVIGCAIEVHREMGLGLAEAVYEECLCFLLREKGLLCERQKPIPVYFRGIRMEKAFVADVIVEGTLLLELKSVEALTAVHKKETINYLRLGKIPVGLLINFNQPLLRDGLVRLVA